MNFALDSRQILERSLISFLTGSAYLIYTIFCVNQSISFLESIKPFISMYLYVTQIKLNVQHCFCPHYCAGFAQQVLENSPNPRNGTKTDQAHPPIHPLKYTDSLQVASHMCQSNGYFFSRVVLWGGWVKIFISLWILTFQHAFIFVCLSVCLRSLCLSVFLGLSVSISLCLPSCCLSLPPPSLVKTSILPF